MSWRAPAVLLAGAACLLLGVLPARAIEPQDVAKALGAALTEGSSVDATFESAERRGDDVVITKLSFVRTAGEDTATFEEVTVAAPTDSDTGVFESPAITFANGTVSGKSNGSVATVTVTGATILDPAQGKKNGFGGSILFRTADASDLHITRAGQEGEISIAHVAVESGDVVGNVAEESRGTVEDITLSPEFIAARGIDPKSIGYDSLVFDLSWDSARDLEARTMTINAFTLSFQDGGELSVDGVVGNLPDPRVLNDEEAASKASTTEVHRLTIRYDDHSLAGRVLDFLAGQQGLTRPEYVEQITAALPFLLMPLNNPTFQSEVASALGSFLQDPRSLVIEIAPESPVSGTELMNLATSTPGVIPDRLKATVTANTPE